MLPLTKSSPINLSSYILSPDHMSATEKVAGLCLLFVTLVIGLFLLFVTMAIEKEEPQCLNDGMCIWGD